MSTPFINIGGTCSPCPIGIDDAVRLLCERSFEKDQLSTNGEVQVGREELPRNYLCYVELDVKPGVSEARKETRARSGPCSQPASQLVCVIDAGNFGTVFVDQSYWQCAVAAKPSQGVWGFLAGGLVWFGVPFCFASTMGLAYLALSQHAGSPLLTDQDVNRGIASYAP